MIPCDWMGMVMMRSETRCTRSTNGTNTIRPGPPRAIPDTPQPEDHGALVLLENAHGQRDTYQHHDYQRYDHIDDGHVASFGMRMEGPPAKPPPHSERGGRRDPLPNVRAFAQQRWSAPRRA